MKAVKINNGYLVRLFRGEKIIEKLIDFSKIHNIKSGTINGIGGASSIELGYYSLETKSYLWKSFPQIHEVLSLSGNISIVDEKPFIHIHVVISNSSFECFGGHLKEAEVGATLEVKISEFDFRIERRTDDEIGLKLLDLHEN